MRQLPLALLLVASIVACSHLGSEKTGKTAEEDFKIATDYFQDKSWPEAQKAFERVRVKYPYSKYAALSELRLADAKFEQDKFIEAAEAYRQFVKMHPTHEDVDYAAFRIGLSNWKDAPSQFFLFPPDIEKDQVQVRAAVTSLQDFIKNYPRSKYVPEAQKLLAEARGKLAEHEWYVAGFYRKRDRWPGVAVRLEGLVRDYPGSKYEPEALQQLIVKHPEDPRRAEAEKLLAQIR
jgi:outer membrane protein assembly factor BamD